MGALSPLERTQLPTEREAELATESSRLLSQMDGTDNQEFRVRVGDNVELCLPSAVKTLLIHLLTEMSKGNAVTIIPVHAELTTQEAAAILNVSRPYLISLLKKGEIPFHKVGTHRRVKYSDLSTYKDRREHAREAAMQELADQAQELDMGY